MVRGFSLKREKEVQFLLLILIMMMMLVQSGHADCFDFLSMMTNDKVFYGNDLETMNVHNFNSQLGSRYIQVYI